MELIMEARNLCSAYLLSNDDERQRARDVLHLDTVLSSSLRTVIEGSLGSWLALISDALTSNGVLLTTW
jgi:hypothetical protein